MTALHRMLQSLLKLDIVFLIFSLKALTTLLLKLKHILLFCHQPVSCVSISITLAGALLTNFSLLNFFNTLCKKPS